MQIYGLYLWALFTGSVSLSLLAITTLEPSLLTPLYRCWARLGLLLSRIVNSLVLSLMFYGMITPLGLIRKLVGRDELSLKIRKSDTHWKTRAAISPQVDFTQQG